MTKLLVVKAHPHVEPSLSLSIGNAFVTAYQESHPDDKIVVRDLYDSTVPALNDTTMSAWKHEKAGQELTAKETALLTRHNKWLNEFMAADKYVFINPMYNLFLPAELKQYIDVMAVPHKTFKYTAHGPVGLIGDRKVIHIQAAGSVYHGPEANSMMTKLDFGDAYLRGIFTLFGVKDFQSIFVEGADQDPTKREAIITAAKEQAIQLARKF
ncbi:FMN-dependent NADH-azoreductase [Ligilactobacillus sp. LYQ112]|uniref:FMN-dependent NADH-azoreductase n=1 Tax=Ligilactobacillus sp. LYQ112 TaxID=3391060 RepID=UPI003983442A